MATELLLYLRLKLFSRKFQHFSFGFLSEESFSDHRVPRLVRAPTNKVVKKGSSVTLECVYEAVPPPEIVWKRKGGSKELTNRSK